MPADSSPRLTLKLLSFQPSLQSPARRMYRVLAIATLLLLAPLASGEAEDQAPAPAVQSKRSDSPAASTPAKSPASASGASSPAPAATWAKAPATSPSTARASSPFVGSVVPERQRPPSPPMPSAGEAPVEAPGPNVADGKSGSVRNGAGLVLGGAVAAWMALGAAF